MLSYRMMYNYQSGLQQNGKDISRGLIEQQYLMIPEDMRMNMHMLMGTYGVTDKLTFMIMFNYLQMKMGMPAGGGSLHNHTFRGEHTMNVSGMGDMGIQTLYELWRSNAHRLMLNTGLNVPVGSNKLKGTSNDMLYPGTAYPYLMQPGSGSWDIPAGINYYLGYSRISAGVSAQALWRSKLNKPQYRLGNELDLTTWMGIQLFPFLSSSVRLRANTSAAVKGIKPDLNKYNEPAANPENYGGKRVELLTGLSFQTVKNSFRHFRFMAEYAFPVYQHLNGIQMPLKQCFFISTTFQF